MSVVYCYFYVVRIGLKASYSFIQVMKRQLKHCLSLMLRFYDWKGYHENPIYKFKFHLHTANAVGYANMKSDIVRYFGQNALDVRGDNYDF